MTAILHPGRWQSKPPLGSLPDTHSGLGIGLVGCFLLQREHPSKVRNLVSGRLYGAGSSTPIWEQGIAGLALDVDGAGVSIKDTAEAALRLQSGTLLWRGYIRSTPADFANIAGVAHNSTDSSPYTSYVFYKDNAGKLTFGFNNGAFQNNGFRNISDFVGNGLHQFVFTFNLQPTTANQSAYTDNGSLDGSGGTSGTIGYDSSAIFLIGDSVGGRDGNTVCQCVYIWDRVLPREEVRSLWREPFQVIAPPRSIISYSFPSIGIPGQDLTGSIGIVSGESFSTGSVTGAITGVSGIPSGESLPTTGAIVAGYIGGEAGIPTGETFGADAIVTGPINGLAGIPSGETFGSTGESVTGPLVGAAGIASGETFSAGSVSGPITGSAGIASAAAMGSDGYIAQPLIGESGIPTAEAFGVGNVAVAVTGYTGIASEEAFGKSGTVYRGITFNLFIRGVDRFEHLKAETMNVQKEMDSRSTASFTLRKRRSDGMLFRPLVNDEVVYLFRGRRIFAGFITQIEEIAFDSRDDEIELRISCGSYRKLAENRVFSKSYEGSSFSMRTIVTDLFEATLEQEGISFESDEDRTITAKRFKLEPEKSADQHLDYIASVFGATWRIDDYRRLRINRTFYDTAPHVLTQDGRRSDGVCIHRKLLVNRNDADYRNRQGLRTGVPVAGQQRTVLAGNGGYDYVVGYAITGKPVVKVDGTAVVVVEVSEIEDESWDFAYTVNTTRLRHNPAQTAYTGSNEIVVVAPSSSLDVFFQSNAAEIARRAAQTGGTGLVEVVSPALAVRDQSAAAAMTSGLMERFGAEAERISWESDVPFWDVGQMVHVRMTAPLVAGLYMIESVTIREVGLTYLTYSIRASAFALPKIVDITYQEGTEPGSWEVDIVVDREHGIEDITDGITLWGIDGWEPIWGSWTVDPVDETTLHIEIPASAGIDLSGLEYSGGLGGSEGGGTAGYGGGEDPFGGVIFGGIPPGPGAVDSGIGVTTNLLRIIDVNLLTLEVTTSADHGFESSFPVDGGFRAAIWGVRGCDNPTTGSTINHVSTRVQITASNKFIPKDVGPLTGADGFVNDGNGFCSAADRFDIANRIWAPVTGLKSFMAAATPGENLATETATFILSNSIPGIASRPLAVASNVTNAWTAERDITAVESVSARIETPADGAPVLIDLKKNGVSIFAAGTYLEIPAGETEIRNTNFAETPLLMEKGDKVTVDVVGVGSDFPGCNATVHLNMRG